MIIITYIRSACQEENLINFEFLLIDNSISNFINISCHQVDVNSFFRKSFQELVTLQPCLLLIILIDMIIYSHLFDDNSYILPYIFIICNTFFIKITSK